MSLATYKTKRSIWSGYIRQRCLVYNQNFLGVVTGPTGSGKTYSSLAMCIEIDPEFDATRIVFTLEELMELINSKKLKSGSSVLFEEIGVSQNAKSHMSMMNKLANFLFQTFRKDNFAVLFTSPDFGFVDASTRKLFHAHFETRRIDRGSSLCVLKPYRIDRNQRTGDVYYKFLHVHRSNGQQHKISEIRTPMPPESLVLEYEKRKDAFTKKLNAQIMEKIKEQTEKKEEKASKPSKATEDEIISEIMANPEIFFNSKGSIDAFKTQAKFDIGNWTAKKIRAKINMGV